MRFSQVSQPLRQLCCVAEVGGKAFDLYAPDMQPKQIESNALECGHYIGVTASQALVSEGKPSAEVRVSGSRPQLAKPAATLPDTPGIRLQAVDNPGHIAQLVSSRCRQSVVQRHRR